MHIAQKLGGLVVFNNYMFNGGNHNILAAYVACCLFKDSHLMCVCGLRTKKVSQEVMEKITSLFTPQDDKKFLEPVASLHAVVYDKVFQVLRSKKCNVAIIKTSSLRA